ncbi:MAG: hypothetical protein LBU23_02275 [Planctomycetota bacterium]|jgi:hypothetical protein|nr:hypothetical protein [Planctomycetota bacterium]
MPEQAVAVPPKKGETAQKMNAEYNRRKSEGEQRREEKRRWVESAKISRVRFVNRKVSVSYGVVENGAHNDFEMESDDEPSSEFTGALQALAPFVAEIVFRDRKEREWQTKDIAVKSVNFKEHDEGGLHAGIGTALTLANGKATALNVPQMPLRCGEDGDGEAHYSIAAAEAIEEVLARTRDYMAGKRAQGNLFARLDD